MKLRDRILREQAIAECIAAVWPIMDVDGDPGPVAHAMLAKLKSMQNPALLGDQPDVAPVDYLERVQQLARTQHMATHGRDKLGRQYEAEAAIPTPMGDLHCVTWLRPWEGDKVSRVAWASEYTLAGDFVSVREIKRAGLARRPTSRNRQTRSNDL